MNKIVIIGAAAGVLLLGGGGAAAFLLMGGEKPAETAAAPEPEPPKPAPVNVPKGTYLKMEPMTAPLPIGDKGRRQMMMMVQLEVASENSAKVEAIMPRIQDAFIRDLHATPVGNPQGWEPGDIETVRRRLMAQANRVAGQGVVFDILIVQAVRVGGV